MDGPHSKADITAPSRPRASTEWTIVSPCVFIVPVVPGIDSSGVAVLRLKIGDKAVCYFRCAADPYKNRKEAHAWANAVNLQWEVNT